jgi:plastocyanin
MTAFQIYGPPVRSRRRRIGFVLAGLLGFGLLVASGGVALATSGAVTSDASDASEAVVAAPTRPPIIIKKFAFQGGLAVLPGATVTVRNQDKVAHTLTAADGSFTTKTIQPGKSATFKAPKKVGDYKITCKFHPDMINFLIVTTKPARPVIVISDFTYYGVLTVPPGVTVAVHNRDTAPHTVTAVNGRFTTKTIQPGKTGTFKAPTKVGKYPITCKIHPDMTGTLVVVRPPA